MQQTDTFSQSILEKSYLLISHLENPGRNESQVPTRI